MKVKISTIAWIYLFIIFFIMLIFDSGNKIHLYEIGLVVISLINIIREILFKRDFYIFEPYIIIPIMFMLYGLGPVFEYGNANSTEVISKYLIIQLIGLCGLILGLEIKRPVYREIHIDITIDATYKNMTYIMLAFSAMSIAILFMNFGGIKEFFGLGYGAERILQMQNMVNIGGGFSWFILTSALFLIWYLKEKSIWIFLMSMLSLIISMIYSLSTASRGPLIYAVIVFFTMYFYAVKKINGRFAVILMLVGIFVSQFISDARYWLIREDFITMINNTINTVKNAPERYLPWMASEFKYPCNSLLLALNNSFSNYLLGAGYLYDLNVIVPGTTRFFSVGTNVGRLHSSLFYSSYIGTGIGWGFSPVTEGYMNFGAIGVFLQMFIYGYFAEGVFRFFQRKQNILGLLVFAGALPCLIIEGIRIQSSTFIYKMLRLYLMPAIIYIILKHLRRSKD